MAYDSRTGEIILFGGFVGGYTDTTIWVYNYSTDKWTIKSPYPHPSAGVQASIAYDSESDRFLVFGGLNTVGPSNETWTYDLNSNAWTRLHPAVSPSSRYGHTLAYDPFADRIILFGGCVGLDVNCPVSDETWAYDLNADTWKIMNPPSKPLGRGWHAMTYDLQARRIVLQGGKVSCDTNIVPNPSCFSGETWAYDFASNVWTRRATGPARYNHALAFDSRSNRDILFGGGCNSCGAGGVFGDTWSYDFLADTWTTKAPASSPPPGCCTPMLYDYRADRTVLFRTYNFPNSWVWAYDFSSDTWSSRPPPPSPGSRWSFGLAFDEQAARTILYGGYVGGYADGTTWAYDATASKWRGLAPAVAPSARAEVGMTYASRHHRAVLFGGAREQAHLGMFDEVWLFDYAQNNWSNPKPAVRPPARSGPGLTYDTSADRVVLFGGAYPGIIPMRAADTWIYDITNNTWANVTPVKSPSAREGPLMSYSARSGKVVLFGGLGTGAWGNETWTYDVSTNVWTNVTPAYSPSPRGLASMAYDGAADRVILFGGSPGGCCILGYDDTWSLDVANRTWVELDPGDRAANLYSHSLVYDSLGKRIILYGGDVTWSYAYAPPVPPGSVTWSDPDVRSHAAWLSWLGPKDTGGAAVLYYRIYRGNSFPEAMYLNTTKVRSYYDRTLESGKTYYYRVRAVNAAGEGPASDALILMTPYEGPLAILATAGLDRIPEGGTVNLSAIVRDVSGHDITSVSTVTWSVSPSGCGSITPETGAATMFRASSTGGGSSCNISATATYRMWSGKGSTVVTITTTTVVGVQLTLLVGLPIVVAGVVALTVILFRRRRRRPPATRDDIPRG